MDSLRSLTIALFVLALSCPLEASSQPVGTWSTYVEETQTTVYVVVRPPLLLVVQQSRSGECMGVPSRTRWNDNGNPVELDWTVRAQGDTLEIDLPPTAVTEARTMKYTRTTVDPIGRCEDTGQET